jgi:hypothetical protein
MLHYVQHDKKYTTPSLASTPEWVGKMSLRAQRGNRMLYRAAMHNLRLPRCARNDKKDTPSLASTLNFKGVPASTLERARNLLLLYHNHPAFTLWYINILPFLKACGRLEVFHFRCGDSCFSWVNTQCFPVYL